MIEVPCQKDDKGFKVLNKDYFRAEVSALPHGYYRLRIDKSRRKKTNEQLGYYYACVLPYFLKAANEAGWEFVNIEELDLYLKTHFANKELINTQTGEILSIPALKRDMTTIEFMTFVDQVRGYASEFLGAYIPEPGEQIQMKL